MERNRKGDGDRMSTTTVNRQVQDSSPPWPANESVLNILHPLSQTMKEVLTAGASPKIGGNRQQGVFVFDLRWAVATLAAILPEQVVAEPDFIGPDIRLAIRYLRARRKNPRRLRGTLRDVDRAQALRFGADRLSRIKLEMWLFAGQAVEATATVLNMPVESVRLYKSLFFNVPDESNAAAKVFATLVCSVRWCGMTEDEFNQIVESLASRKCSEFFDFMVRSRTLPLGIPTRLEDLTIDEMLQLYAKVRIRSLIAETTMPHEQKLRQRILGEPTPGWDALAQELEALIETMKTESTESTQQPASMMPPNTMPTWPSPAN